MAVRKKTKVKTGGKRKKAEESAYQQGGQKNSKNHQKESEKGVTAACITEKNQDNHEDRGQTDAGQ
jgi:hypothetical protein